MFLGPLNYLGATAYLGSGGGVDPGGIGTLVTWNDLTASGTSGRFTFHTLDGWESLPETRHEDIPRPGQHGSFDQPVYVGSRRVVVAGRMLATEDRNARLAELQQAFRVEPDHRLLTIRHAGRTLSVAARIKRFTFTPSQWGSGAFSWLVEWVAADPYRYGLAQQHYTTLPELVGGLEFDLFTDGSETTGFLEYGEQGSTGRMTLTNEGNADAWPIFEVAGPAPQGFAIQHVESGRRVVSATNIPAGSVLTVNFANGMATLDGVDRSGQLTVREWSPVPAGGSATFAFSAPVESAASLTATIRSTYW